MTKSTAVYNSSVFISMSHSRTHFLPVAHGAQTPEFYHPLHILMKSLFGNGSETVCLLRDDSGEMTLKQNFSMSGSASMLL